MLRRSFENRSGADKSRELLSSQSHNSYDQDYALDNLQKLAGGNLNIVIEMLQIFLENADHDILALQASCNRNDWERAGAMAHKLIPSSEYLSLNKLAKLLKEIKIKSAAVHDQNAIIPLVTQVCDIYAQVRPKIILDLRNLKRSRF